MVEPPAWRFPDRHRGDMPVPSPPDPGQDAPAAPPRAGVALSPAVAAVLMSASTIVVALNAQLLRQVRLDSD